MKIRNAKIPEKIINIVKISDVGYLEYQICAKFKARISDATNPAVLFRRIFAVKYTIRRESIAKKGVTYSEPSKPNRE